MRHIIKDALRAAWSCADSAAVIAARARLSERQVQRFWEAEKIAGRLPDQPRPHFIKFSPALSPGFDADDDAADVDLDDDTPIGGPMGLRIPDPDPLLAALIEHHGNDPWLAVSHVMPKQTLQMEANGYPPSESRLRQFNRTRDAVMRALHKRRDQRLAAEAREQHHGGR